jgi:hypothetical protein
MPGQSGVKHLISDAVSIETTDLGACAITTAKIGAKQVTSAKLNVDVGKIASGSWVSGATTLFTGTAAFTILGFWVQTTAAGTSGKTMNIEVGTTAIATFTCSTAYSFSSPYNGLVNTDGANIYTATTCFIVDVAALGSVTATAAAGLAGKWYMLYIATQT